MPKFPNTEDLFFINKFDNFAKHYLKQFKNNILTPSISYTFLTETKRFRPLLIIYMAKTLNLDYKTVLPWALSIEMVHNFSLIHDDLPCMDDDDLRRAKPSNHKVFGEALALLSGNSLLVEAFAVLAQYFLKTEGHLCGDLIKELTQAVGSRGMMLGQAGDLILNKKIATDAKQKVMSKELCNQLKTGLLIKASVLGVFYIYQDSIDPNNKINIKQKEAKSLKNQLNQFSNYLGAAFQWADDLVDCEGDKDLIKQKLKQDSQKALACLKNLPANSQALEHLVIANQTHFK